MLCRFDTLGSYYLFFAASGATLLVKDAKDL